ncbi:MAG: ribosomal RNA small subunit methyltransferase A [Candidatus Vogelbacteria bacterium]|nr:ribosomal RNA small subunit methyltransferase A [Candidatus Vogelbacteria bacterium]
MRAKKSLGQNFLRSREIIKIIIAAARLQSGETVLEVGPGAGVLTVALLEAGARVIAVEKDDQLFSLLQEKFAAAVKNKQLELIHADILDFSLQANKLKTYKLIANIPYYLTGRLLRKFLTSDHQPILAVLMLQKEVAERVIAKDGRGSILSISVKAYGEPRYLKTVSAKLFSPRPKVDSAVVLIDKISRDNFRQVSEEKFFYLLKRGFAARRKMLKNNLPLEPERFAACQIAERARAENLKFEQWLCLAN